MLKIKNKIRWFALILILSFCKKIESRKSLAINCLDNLDLGSLDNFSSKKCFNKCLYILSLLRLLKKIKRDYINFKDELIVNVEFRKVLIKNIISDRGGREESCENFLYQKKFLTCHIPTNKIKMSLIKYTKKILGEVLARRINLTKNIVCDLIKTSLSFKIQNWKCAYADDG